MKLNVGARIKSLRESKKMTQLDLATLINVSKANMSKYESGLVEPNLEIMNHLCDIFDVSLDYLSGRSSYREISNDTKSKPLTPTQQKLIDFSANLSEEQIQDVLDYIEFKKYKREKGNKQPIKSNSNSK